MSSQRVTFTTSIDRATYFRFRDLCHAHKVPIERAVEVLLRETLKQNGIEVRPEDSSTTKAEGAAMGKV